MKKRIEHRLPLLLFLLVLLIVLGTNMLLEKGKENWLDADSVIKEEFRRQAFSEEIIEFLQNQKEKPGRDAGLYLLETELGKGTLQKAYQETTFDQLEKKWKKQASYQSYQNICAMLWDDVKYFPVPVSKNDKAATVSYTDSWLYERSYRGNGVHEGTDIMADKNQRGYYPVVSMTDGTITNLGWLELGGYRVGITAPGGAYFYYAHLSSYASVKEGMQIKAGDLLGFMGDSGYGKEEGTIGKFPVHLHVGIYLYLKGKEVSYNPYWMLRYIENNRLTCRYE